MKSINENITPGTLSLENKLKNDKIVYTVGSVDLFAIDRF